MKDISGVSNALKDAIVSVGWTHKIQEKQAEIYLKRSKILVVALLVSSGVSSSSSLITLFHNVQWIRFIIALSALITFVLTGILKTWDYKNMAHENKEYANKLYILRERLMDCLRDLAYELKLNDEIYENWNKLEKERLDLGIDSPYTSPKAVKKASFELKNRNDNVRDTDYQLFISNDILKKLNGEQK